jgi:hypothetical protein
MSVFMTISSNYQTDKRWTPKELLDVKILSQVLWDSESRTTVLAKASN